MQKLRLSESKSIFFLFIFILLISLVCWFWRSHLLYIHNSGVWVVSIICIYIYIHDRDAHVIFIFLFNLRNPYCKWFNLCICRSIPCNCPFYLLNCLIPSMYTRIKSKSWHFQNQKNFELASVLHEGLLIDEWVFLYENLAAGICESFSIKLRLFIHFKILRIVKYNL